jgi:2'-5' RNA ligase
MFGVATALDGEHYKLVEDLWREFKERFGVHGIHITPIPHFSYHVADSYELDLLDDMMYAIVRDFKPFTVKTNGLGVFTGKTPVLYIPVVRNPSLAALHQRVWEAANPISVNPLEYYSPDNWRPHITLTHHDVDHDLLPSVIRSISERNFNWSLTVDSLSLIGGDDVRSLRSRIFFDESLP